MTLAERLRLLAQQHETNLLPREAGALRHAATLAEQDASQTPAHVREVTGCGDCPHCSYGECEGPGCRLALSQHELDCAMSEPLPRNYWEQAPPDWCPLRQGPALVRLRGKSDG